MRDWSAATCEAQVCLLHGLHAVWYYPRDAGAGGRIEVRPGIACFVKAFKRNRVVVCLCKGIVQQRLNRANLSLGGVIGRRRSNTILL